MNGIHLAPSRWRPPSFRCAAFMAELHGLSYQRRPEQSDLYLLKYNALRPFPRAWDQRRMPRRRRASVVILSKARPKRGAKAWGRARSSQLTCSPRRTIP